MIEYYYRRFNSGVGKSKIFQIFKIEDNTLTMYSSYHREWIYRWLKLDEVRNLSRRITKEEAEAYIMLEELYS